MQDAKCFINWEIQMKFIKYFILAFILFISQVHAQPGPINNVFEIGAPANSKLPLGIFPISTGLFTIIANTSSNSSPGYLALTQMSGGAANGQYQVTNTKTAICFGFWAISNNSFQGLEFGYGTAALASNNTSTPPTGSVQYSAASNVASYALASPFPQAIYYNDIIQFPSQSYPYVLYTNQSGGFQSIYLPCMEY